MPDVAIPIRRKVLNTLIMQTSEQNEWTTRSALVKPCVRIGDLSGPEIDAALAQLDGDGYVEVRGEEIRVADGADRTLRGVKQRQNA
ncbi:MULTISPECIES: hypothetical protein [Haloarcula]|jgi:hypothetical protein|uniref:hypothetical protein n=1 Tax=Haloarcula TaxID=2237 RepID=UPI000F8D8526|nr:MULTISPECIES: hypothetical protein [Haloarcula]NHX42006.1 hypothetical protein [Haloarcula sp. R1-2]